MSILPWPELPFGVPGCHPVYTQPPSFEPLFPCCPSLATPVTLQACKSGLFRLREKLKLPCFQAIALTPPHPLPPVLAGFSPTTRSLYPVGAGNAGAPSGPRRTIAPNSRRGR